MDDLSFLPAADEQQQIETPVEPSEAPGVDLSFLPAADPVHDKVNENFNVTKGVQPDHAAQVLDMSKRSGLPKGVVEADPETVRDQLERPDFDQLPDDLMSYYTYPENVEISRDDHEQLGYISQLWQDAKASYEQGSEGVVDLGDLYYRKHILGETNEQLDEQIAELEANAKVRAKRGERDDIFGYLVTAAAEQLPIMGEMVAGGIEQGSTGAMMGAMVAAAAGQMGPQIATPEELVTMPLGFAIGGSKGFAVGMATQAFQMEAGHAAAEFMAIKDENGEALDPAIAKTAGVAVGAINAALEMIGGKAVLKTLPGGEKLLQSFTRGGVKQALKNRSVREALLTVGRRYGAAVGTEGLTEMAQEAVNIIAGEIAKNIDEQLHDTYYEDADSQESVQRVLEAGKKAAAAAVMLGAPGTAWSARKGVRGANSAQQYFEKQMEINEAVNASKTKERSPEKMAEFLEGIGLGDDVFVPGEAAEELFQSDPQAFEALGVKEEDIAEAAALGQDLKIKTSALHSKLEPQQFKQIAEVMKAAPGAMSAKELNEVDMEAEVSRASEQYEEAMANEAAYKGELERIHAQVMAAGGTQEYADEYIKLLDGFSRRMALEGRELTDTIAKIEIASKRQQQGHLKGKELDDSIKEPALDQIGGVSREDLGKMLASGDRSALEHVKAAVAEHGPLPVQDAVRNEMLKAVTLSPNRKQAKAKIAELENELNEIMASDEYNQDGQLVTDSEAFKEWFGNSEVREPRTSSKQRFEDMPPMPVYFGNTGGIAAFSAERQGNVSTTFGGNSPTTRQGIFAAENPDFASTFAEGEGGAITPAYMSIQNALYLDEGFTPEIIKELEEVGLKDARELRFVPPSNVWGIFDGDEGAAFVEAAKAAGYDGVYMTEEAVGMAEDAEEQAVWVAFSPEQIKSVYNRGTFDPNDPRILNQSAYHGSPHRFDEFSLDAIGTGEGAQAYGWGLYFAGKKEVAEWYRKNLSEQPVIGPWKEATAMQLLAGEGLTEREIDAVLRMSASYTQTIFGKTEKVYSVIDGPMYSSKERGLDFVRRALKAAEKAGKKGEKPKSVRVKGLGTFPLETLEKIESALSAIKGGQLYEVDIPEDSELLNYDKPLTKQHKNVKEILKRAGVWKEFRANKSNFASSADTRADKGSGVYAFLRKKFGSEKEASLYLASIGIKGLKYLDGTSRAAGKGDHNFVIFDDQAVDVTNTFYQEANAFNEWAEGAEIVEEPQSVDFQSGVPVVVKAFHGTTHEFNEIEPSITNIENYYGRGLYLSSSEQDVWANYQGDGPDLTRRIDAEAEAIEVSYEDDEILDDQIAEELGLSVEEVKRLVEDEGTSGVAKRLAEKRLVGEHPEGKAMELYAKMKNPLVLTPDGGTEFIMEVDWDYYREMAEEDEYVEKDEYVDEDGEFDKDGYEEALEDAARDLYYEDYNPEVSGNGAKLQDAISMAARDFDDIDEGMIWSMLEEEFSNFEDGVSAQAVFDYMRNSEEMFATDPDTGKLVNGEFLRRIAEELGYDGIIMDADHANDSWHMEIEEGTRHFIVWGKNQIKSVENEGGFSLRDNNIYHQPDQNTARGSVKMTGLNHFVTLFEGADLSTLLHETGHIFLEEIRTTIAAGLGSPALQRDWGAIQKWLGAQDIKLNVEQHEKFARGFEAYLREGVAPSEELTGAFERFKKWLVSVYRDVKMLDVTLTDEIRLTFDRLLATDEQIASAATSYEIVARTKKDLEKLGIKGDDKDYVNRLIKQGTQKAVKAMQRAKDRHLTKMKAKWRKQAQTEILKQPVYALRDNLYKNGGMALEEVKAEYGDEIVAKLRKKNVRFLKKDGRSLEALAAAHAFESADAMIDALLNSTSKQERVKEMVEEKLAGHDGEFRPEDFLVSQTETAEALEVVGRYIGRALGKETPISRKALRAAAQKQLRGMMLKDAARPDRFLAAMASAIRKERRATSKGDFDVALRENTKARYNLELSKQAKKLRGEMQQTKKRAVAVAKMRSKKGQKARIEGGFHENIKALVARFGLADVNFKQDKPALAKLLAPSDDALLDVGAAFDDWLISEQDSRPYQTLNADEFKQLSDLLRHLEHKGRGLVKQYVEHAKMEAQELAGRIAEQAAQLPNKKVWAEDSKIGKIIEQAREYFAGTDMMLFVMKRLDAYKNTGKKGKMGLAEKHIFRALADANDAETRLKEELAQKIDAPIKQLMDSLMKHPKKLLDTGVEVPEIMKRRGQSWTFERVLAVALNMGNSTNRQRVLDGYGLEDADLLKLTRYLSDEDWKAVQQLWDAINTLWQPANEVFYKLNMFSQEKVEAEPFMTPTGMKMRGGYYPIKFDSGLNKITAARQEKDDLLNATHAMFPTPAAYNGMMKARQASGGGMPVKLSLSVLGQHLDFMTRYITHAQVVRDIDRVIKNEAFVRVVEDKLGPQVYAMLRPSLAHVARAEGETLNVLDRMLDKHRVMATGYILGANVSVATKQIYSLSGYWQDEGFGTYAKGVASFMSNPMKAIRTARELSAYIRSRGSNVDRDIRDSLRKFKLGEKSIKGVTLTDARNAMFILIKAMDYAAVYPAWWASFNKGMKVHEGDIQQAVRHADEAVAASQPSSRPIDMSHFQRSRKGLHRLFTMFSTFTMKYGNRQRYFYGAMRAGEINKARWMENVIMEAILPPLAMRLMFCLFWDREPNAEDMLWDVLLYQFMGLPLVRDVVGSIVSAGRGKFVSDPGDSPAFTGLKLVTRLGTSVWKWLDDLEDDDKMEKALWAFAEMASYTTGIPAARVAKKLKKGMEQYEDGEGTPMNILIPNPDTRR